MFLDVDLNLLVLQRGNLLMSTAVLTLRSSIALWMIDFPANGMNLQNLQIRGFLRSSAEDVRHLSLVVFTS